MERQRSPAFRDAATPKTRAGTREFLEAPRPEGMTYGARVAGLFLLACAIIALIVWLIR
ncbi:MAG TPA: hypothetical protein VEY94_00460 [Patescibacteria group bacterium]|nr:hypothetical protein [Patescibacteria group bacterium]